MEKHDTIRMSMTLTAMSSCGALSTGRCISAFYAQTGAASWLGIGISSLFFGWMIGCTLHFKRKTCANCLMEMYISIFGRKFGSALMLLHTAFFAVTGYALLQTAKETAMLALPIDSAGTVSVIFALFASLWLSRRNVRTIKSIGCTYILLLVCMMMAMLAFGKAPDHGTLNFYVRLRLENDLSAAILLSSLHASLAGGMCASAVIRLSDEKLHPVRTGILSAMVFAFVLTCENAVFAAFPQEINALKLPFVVLCASWGKPGFYLVILMRSFETLVSLSGIFCALPRTGITRTEIRC